MEWFRKIQAGACQQCASTQKKCGLGPPPPSIPTLAPTAPAPIPDNASGSSNPSAVKKRKRGSEDDQNDEFITNRPVVAARNNPNVLVRLQEGCRVGARMLHHELVTWSDEPVFETGTETEFDEVLVVLTDELFELLEQVKGMQEDIEMINSSD